MKQRASKVLLVSYFFPPAGGVSVQRMLSLSRYLPRDRCQVGVLTALNGAYPVSDPGLLEKVPKDVKIHRAFTPELPYELRRKIWERLGGGKKNVVVEAAPQPEAVAAGSGNVVNRAKQAVRDQLRRAFMPDPQVVWRPFAERMAARLIQEEGYDTLVVTAPPFSSFLIGNAIKRRFPHVTLVSDFRDDWFGFFLGGVDNLASEAKREQAKRIERETVRCSDLVVAVTDATRDDIRARYPEEAERKFAVIPNGYDPAAIPEIPKATQKADRMVVTYVGTVYKPCSPRYYLDALERLPVAVRERIETRFVGRVIDQEKPFFENRTSNLKLTGFVAQAEALRHLGDADYLLLVIDDPQTLSGKLFEYLATGKPILGLTPADSESAKLVRKANAGVICEPRNVEAISQMLLDAFRKWEAGQHQGTPAWEEIRRFERPRLAERYHALMAESAAPQVELAQG